MSSTFTILTISVFLLVFEDLETVNSFIISTLLIFTSGSFSQIVFPICSFLTGVQFSLTILLSGIVCSFMIGGGGGADGPGGGGGGPPLLAAGLVLFDLESATALSFITSVK